MRLLLIILILIINFACDFGNSQHFKEAEFVCEQLYKLTQNNSIEWSLKNRNMYQASYNELEIGIQVSNSNSLFIELNDSPGRWTGNLDYMKGNCALKLNHLVTAAGRTGLLQKLTDAPP